MTKLTIGELLNLIASKVPNPESRLEKVFECAPLVVSEDKAK